MMVDEDAVCISVGLKVRVCDCMLSCIVKSRMAESSGHFREGWALKVLLV